MRRIIKKVRYFNLNGKDISKYPLILDLLTIIGSSHNADGSIDIDVQYTELFHINNGFKERFMRYMNCVKCGKRLYEGKIIIRYKPHK